MNLPHMYQPRGVITKPCGEEPMVLVHGGWIVADMVGEIERIIRRFAETAAAIGKCVKKAVKCQNVGAHHLTIPVPAALAL